ncbi:hypothetical protein WJX81_005051 [Elliptochloris bilobata]|uniref:Uncharacterized protein n=1 Tax=Elliptochloris bilobata TaxID=381761 RepID=A0AAW1RA17_9CHLO
MAARDATSARDDERLQEVLDRNRAGLEQAGHSQAATSWLKPSLESDKGTDQVYSLLQRHVERDAFVKQLELAKVVQNTGGASAGEHGCEVLREAWWEPPAGEGGPSHAGDPAVADAGFTEVTHEAAAGAEGEALDSYVVVDREDVLEAMGAFIAAYLAALPEAENLQPAQLQSALKQAFKELRKSRVRRLWDMGRMIYRLTAFSYGAFSVYENPWLVRAVLAALWTASRVILRTALTGLIL